MPAPAAVFLAPTAGGIALINKKKQARRQQAAANKWSTQFPLVDDFASQQALIDKANLQLRNLQGKSGKGESKQTKVDRLQLSKWIGVMKAQAKDLKTGLDMASTNQGQAPSPDQIQNAPLPVAPIPTRGSGLGQGSAPAGNSLSSQEVAQAEANGENIAADTKKPTNWLLIGGIAVGAILLFSLMRRK